MSLQYSSLLNSSDISADQINIETAVIASGTISDLKSNTITTEFLAVNNNATIGNLTSSLAVIDSLTGSASSFSNSYGTTSVFTNVTAASYLNAPNQANINDLTNSTLTSTTATISTANIATANITTANVTTGNLASLNSTLGNISSLTGGTSAFTNCYATNSNFTNSTVGSLIVTNCTASNLNMQNLSASLPLKLDSSKNLISEQIDLGTSEVKNTLPINKGGTNNSSALSGNRVMVSSGGQIIEHTSAMSDGSLMIGSTSSMPVVANLTGTNNRVIVTNGPGSITLSTPQDIATNSNVTFSQINATTSSLGSASATSLNVSTLTATTSSLGSASVSSLLSSGTMSCGTNSMTHGSLTSGSISCGTNSVSCGSVLATSVMADSGSIKSITAITGITTTSLTSGNIGSTGTFTNGTNAMTTGSLSCTSVTSSGTMSCGTNSMTCGSLSSTSVTSSGTMSCGTNSMTCGSLLCTSETSSGPIKINGTSNYLELNADSKTKEGNAGKIGYDLFTSGLNFVGGGTSSATRAIYCYAEGSFETNGPFICTGLKLPTSGGTQTTLTYYEEGSLSDTYTGIWSSSQSITIYFTRVGKMVNVMFPNTFTTANTAATITLGTGLPTRLRPLQSVYMPVIVLDNGTNKIGSVVFRTTGQIEIYPDGGSSNYVGFGNSGVYGFSSSWRV